MERRRRRPVRASARSRAEPLACSMRPHGCKRSRRSRPSSRRSWTRTRRRSRASRDASAKTESPAASRRWPRADCGRRAGRARPSANPVASHACPPSSLSGFSRQRGRRILHENKDREGGVPRAVMRSIVAAVAIWLAPCASALAQDYPTRTVRIIIPLGPGGGGDVFTRALADELQKALRQPVVVENRTGGALNIGTRACAEAPPDGYTICVLSSEPRSEERRVGKE